MLRPPHTLRFSVPFACADLSLKLRRNTEKAHRPFGLTDYFLLSSVVENMSDDMLYVALAIVCKKNVGRRQLTTSKWTKDWSSKRNFLSHTNLLSELVYQKFVLRVFLLRSEYSSTNIHVACIFQ
jgi:hypothetical protein